MGLRERLLSADLGINTWFSYDESSDRIFIRKEDAVAEARAEVNNDTRKYSSARDRWDDSKPMGVHVARLPLTIYYDLLKRGILRDPVEMKKWLDRPENDVFRTRKGRLS